MKTETEAKTGTLFVVSTPLGNLEDITLRALRVLKEVDLVAAETVEHTRNLCRHFGITTELTAFNQHNQRTKGPVLVGELKSGRSVALVTNAGTPAISDPGVFLVASALKEGIPVSSDSGALCSDRSSFRVRDEGGHFSFLRVSVPSFGKAEKRARDPEIVALHPRVL